MDTALPQKFPFILDRNLAKANCTGNQVCTSCDIVVFELWIKLKSAGNFKAMSISYHAAIIKRMLGLPKRFSNHFACNFLVILTFEHFLGNIYFRYLSWPFKCNSLCFNPFKLYFIRHSTYAQYIYDRFLTKYDISDLLRQDKDAVLARLFFIQHRELSSFYGLL